MTSIPMGNVHRVSGRNPSPPKRRSLPRLVEVAADQRATPTITDAPADVAQKLAEVQAAEAQWRDEHARLLAMPAKNVAEFVASIGDGGERDSGMLFSTADAVRLGLFDLLERRVRQHTAAAEAFRAAAEPLAAVVEKDEAALEKARVAARKKLTAAGAGLESQPAWPSYQDIAERQFRQAIEQTTGVIEAREALKAARGRLSSAKGWANEFDTLRAETIQLVREAAEGAVAL